MGALARGWRRPRSWRRARSLALIDRRVRDVAARWIACDDSPCARAILELVVHLHRALAAFDVKIHLRLGVVSLDRDLFNVRIKCLEIQIAGVLEMLLDRRANLCVGCSGGSRRWARRYG